MTAFNPPPRICPACSTANPPLATICRTCAVDMRRPVAAGRSPGLPSPTHQARRSSSTNLVALAAAIVLVVAAAAAAFDLTGVIGRSADWRFAKLEAVAGRPAASPTASPTSRPSPSSAPGPSENLVRVGQTVELAGVETHTVLRVEDWPGETPAGPGQRYLAVEVQVRTLPGASARFDQLYYTVENGAGVLRNAPQVGRQPALAYGVLGPGQSVIGWVSFLVPDPGPFILTYRYPLGTNGQTTDERIALDPILPPSPEPVQPAGPSPGSTSLPNLGFPAVLPSTNYSGYGAQLPGRTVSSVSGSWVQPAVHCSGKETSSVATWVGIDDGGLRDLEQVGTEAVCRSGSSRPTYVSWYEMFPLTEVVIATIRPGDHFTASVAKRGITWTLAIRDTNTGRVFSTKQARNAAAIQALWVVEAPSRILANGTLQVLPLTSFSRITMTGCSAVVGGTRRVISDSHWAHYRFDMRTTGGTAKALTSALTGGGTAFSSTWKHR